MNRAENNLPAIDEIRISLPRHNNPASQEVLRDGIQDAVCRLNGDAHHQYLRLKRPEIDSNREGESWPLVVIRDPYDMPSMLTNVRKHLNICIVDRIP
jgi:hypothetical protein